MPKRQSIKNIPTPELQGDDSYVIYRPMTFEEAQELRNIGRKMQADVDKALNGYATKNKIELKDMTAEQNENALAEAGLNPDEIFDFMHKQMAERIIEWNWVDDDDKPLPQPKDDYRIIRKLYTTESDFITDLFTNQSKDPKN